MLALECLGLVFEMMISRNAAASRREQECVNREPAKLCQGGMKKEQKWHQQWKQRGSLRDYPCVRLRGGLAGGRLFWWRSLEVTIIRVHTCHNVPLILWRMHVSVLQQQREPFTSLGPSRAHARAHALALDLVEKRKAISGWWRGAGEQAPAPSLVPLSWLLLSRAG